MGLGISYQDFENLYATWTAFDMKQQDVPTEIAIKRPLTALTDNDDFLSDTLTGRADSDHRTNEMLVQSQNCVQVPDTI